MRFSHISNVHVKAYKHLSMQYEAIWNTVIDISDKDLLF